MNKKLIIIFTAALLLCAEALMLKSLLFQSQNYLSKNPVTNKLPDSSSEVITFPQRPSAEKTKQSLSNFYSNALARGRNISKICPPVDAVNRAILAAYGAIYVSSRDLDVPANCLPTSEQIETFHQRAHFATTRSNGVLVTLQKPALDAFMAASAEARRRGLTLTPLGSRASARDFRDTQEIWHRHVQIGIGYANRWINSEEAARLRSRDIRVSVAAALEVEKRGILLGAGGSKSIIQIAAPPGTSQHIAGLAIDIKENASAEIRYIMARHGYFQTVARDFTHFTFLGCRKQDLASLGLRKKVIGGREFYVPKLS